MHAQPVLHDKGLVMLVFCRLFSQVLPHHAGFVMHGRQPVLQILSC